jgi:ADP-ribose pyrophosphatase
MALPPSSAAASSSSNTPFVERTLHQELLYQGGLFKLRLDTVSTVHQQEAKRFVFEHPGAVCILPQLADGRFLMVRQFRYATGQVLLEAPAGKLDQVGEPPLAAAQRELQEETAHHAAHWEDWGLLYTAPGFCTEAMYLHYATGLSPLEQHHLGVEDESLELVALSEAELKQAIVAGQLTDGKTLALLAHYWVRQPQALPPR